MGSKVFSSIILLTIAFLITYGCVDTTGRSNFSNNTSAVVQSSNISSVQANGTTNAEGNATQNQSAAPPWPRYNTSAFSFPYAPELTISETKNGPNGLFTGNYELPGRTSEIMAVRYIDTLATYGQGKDFDYKANPTKAASDFLLQDKNEDTMGFFMKADSIGEISTFTLGTDAYCAEIPFTMTLDSGTKYTGYALTLYIPGRSMLVDVRILALDPSFAKSMRDGFLYGFRLV